MSLFQTGTFTLASGLKSTFKVDVDFLTDEDIATVALMLVHRLPAFGTVEGVPTGGLRLAEAMRPYSMRPDSINYPLLIVDDVYTTGGSIRRFIGGHRSPHTIGAVIFDRSLDGTPDWITPLWRLTP